MVALVDYGMGNRRSVEKALERVGARVKVTSDQKEIEAADGLVIPGVGAFPQAMANLEQLGLPDVIRERADKGVPVLGICLGMQLLFERSEEGERTTRLRRPTSGLQKPSSGLREPTSGLGLLPGEVTWLDTGGLPLPHIGWNHVHFVAPSPLIDNLPESGCAFYHAHSLAARPKSPKHTVGTADYGERFTTIVARGHIFGVQFHPEKSSAGGLALLRSFIALCLGERLQTAARA